MANELIAEAITDYLGERCLDYAEGCPTCEAWAEYDRLYTRPAAPVGGLETYAHDNGSISGLCRNEKGPWVLYSQAEDIIAAKDVRIEELLATDLSKLEECNCLKEQINELEADNAALTARVKELGGDRDHWKENHDCVLGKYRLATQRPDLPVDRLPAIRKLEALETQLAAARKALEDIAHPKALTSLSRDKARAALEAKP